MKAPPWKFDVDVLICGAGVIGLAIARALARRGREVLVVDAASSFGTKTSSRNSEVIHAGIYYTPGSLKAELCVEGKHLLYQFCQEYGVPHRRCGKLIVATDPSQECKLSAIKEIARKNGVTDLIDLPTKQVVQQQYEPEIECTKALFSPSTGIIDSHQYMLALLGDAEEHGASFAFNTRLKVEKVSQEGYVQVMAPETSLPTSPPTNSPGNSSRQQEERATHLPPSFTMSNNSKKQQEEGAIYPPSSSSFTLSPRLFINCAGLHALSLARDIGLIEKDASPIPPPRYCKGNYFRLQGRSPFSHLVYPIPEAAGLGVHATIDLGGQTRFGPDTQWVDDPDDLYVDPQRADSFYATIRRYWPALQDGQLVADYAGIRPKLQAPEDNEATDFRIEGGEGGYLPTEGEARRATSNTSMNGVVNLLGLESPGLTASLAIADFVVDRCR